MGRLAKSPKGAHRVPRNEETLRTLIDHLNDDLAGEYNAIISYIQYSAKVTGPYRPQLVQFLQAEIPDEQRHAQYLADKIASLGGTPVVTPRPVPTSDDTREMLQFIYEAEAQTVENYRARIEEAEAAGEIGLKIQLEEMLSDESTHRDETRKMLDGWQ
jgi:bacterioferritin